MQIALGLLCGGVDYREEKLGSRLMLVGGW